MQADSAKPCGCSRPFAASSRAQTTLRILRKREGCSEALPSGSPCGANGVLENVAGRGVLAFHSSRRRLRRKVFLVPLDRPIDLIDDVLRFADAVPFTGIPYHHDFGAD